jgi:hypothetical protein
MWFICLIYSDYTDDEKVKYWNNTIEHFKGNHRFCPGNHFKEHPTPPYPQMQNPEAVKELTDFLDKTAKLLSHTHSGVNSQRCESFNAMKARYASKEIAWKLSWDTRIMCAVLQMNDPETWRFTLYAELKLPPLKPEVEARIRKKSLALARKNALRTTVLYRAAERKKRREKKAASARQTKGKEDYHMSSAKPRAARPNARAMQPTRTLRQELSEMVVVEAKIKTLPTLPPEFSCPLVPEQFCESVEVRQTVDAAEAAMGSDDMDDMPDEDFQKIHQQLENVPEHFYIGAHPPANEIIEIVNPESVDVTEFYM